MCARACVVVVCVVCACALARVCVCRLFRSYRRLIGLRFFFIEVAFIIIVNYIAVRRSRPPVQREATTSSCPERVDLSEKIMQGRYEFFLVNLSGPRTWL
jgi:hypothetical protein